MAAATWIARRLGWLVAVLAIAFGSAGLTGALDGLPATTAREELTWTTDQSLQPAIGSLVTDLGPLLADFDALSAEGRTAIAALAAADANAIDAAIAAGQILVEKITAETVVLRQRIAALPGTGSGQETRLGTAVVERIAKVGRTLDTTEGIARAWAVLSNGGAAASRLALLLSMHDEATGESVRQGSQGNYGPAIRQLDRADPLLIQAMALRDQLGNTADVSTLSDWLDRNAVIDAALRHLYTILALTGGTVTDDARKAYDDVRLAQRQLPPDTRALVVIMAELAQAGLNQAVIRIEQARGLLAGAVASLAAGPDRQPVPAATAAPSSEAPAPPSTIGPPSPVGPPPSPVGPPPSSPALAPSATPPLPSVSPATPAPSVTPPDA